MSEAHKGYYSVIQFCPDRGRAESVNLGLVLYVPGLKQLEVRTAALGHRARALPPGSGRDAWWVNSVRKSFEEQLRGEYRAGAINTTDELQNSLAKLGNDVIAVPLRPVRVEDAKRDFESLFARLVVSAPEERAETIPPSARRLHEAFVSLAQQVPSVAVGKSFDIPAYQRTIESDYFYPNGTANLVKLLKVEKSVAKAMRNAFALGAEARIVQRHLKVNGLNSRIVVVAVPVGESAAIAKTDNEFAQLREDFSEARWVSSPDIQRFISEVQNTAH